MQSVQPDCLEFLFLIVVLSDASFFFPFFLLFFLLFRTCTLDTEYKRGVRYLTSVHRVMVIWWEKKKGSFWEKQRPNIKLKAIRSKQLHGSVEGDSMIQSIFSETKNTDQCSPCRGPEK